ncbi:hypothetical protein Leryth_019716 [Lithospermum erythrorhizon]|uniref:Uncharacterized protein n=1 Tax=Lithospermum erythrorhizon TaxID=34254 RepID=A0AAV3RS71_LITER|nr:hypothetical protein Leryth_019716 [Lithospermum erythrorhizon]
MGHNAAANAKSKNKEKKQAPKKDKLNNDYEKIVKKDEKNKLIKQNQDDDDVDEHEGVSVHSPCKRNLEEQTQVDLEIKLLEALEIYPPAKLRGIHRHFVLYGLTEYLRRSFNRSFTPDDVLKLLDQFYDLEMVKPDDEDSVILNQEEDFSLPPNFLANDDT